MSRHIEHCTEFYINGRWTAPAADSVGFEVINPSDESRLATLSMGGERDVKSAVNAAKKAFSCYSITSIAERLELLNNINNIYQKRYSDIAETISLEMGAPLKFAEHGQAACGIGHINATIEALKKYTFTLQHLNAQIIKEPIGVCALITPWNWPINQIACKVAPALACGCTCVLKPSELAPLSALLFAEILDEAEIPAGVFNLVNGTGAEVGQALCAHADVDMVSFTGSTRAGIQVAQTAAQSVKRVTQELGGKSPYIILSDIQSGPDLNTAVLDCCKQLFLNSGQSCNAPSRLLVPQHLQKEAALIASEYASTRLVGHALMPNINTGPVVSQTQYNKVQYLIQTGIDEGARLICGGTGKPEGLTNGYFVRPTVFADVDNSMQIAKNEIFGPVLCILPYHGDDEAINLANDTPYGLAAYIYSNNIDHAKNIAALLRVGMVHINGADNDFDLPFGGYKQSGNGREWGKYGFEDYLEIKAIMGYR